MTKSEPTGPSRVETVLAYMGAGVIGLSLVSILVTLLGTYFGASNLELFAQISLLGMPVGFVLVLVLLVLALRRKGRENKS
ncbi:MAG: hypothetical protein WAO31_02030 [Rhodoluna sp.]